MYKRTHSNTDSRVHGARFSRRGVGTRSEKGDTHPPYWGALGILPGRVRVHMPSDVVLVVVLFLLFVAYILREQGEAK